MSDTSDNNDPSREGSELNENDSNDIPDALSSDSNSAKLQEEVADMSSVPKEPSKHSEHVREKRPMTDFDVIVRSIKSKRAAKHSFDPDDLEQMSLLDEKIRHLISRMMEAFQNDQAALQSKLPAVHKLKLLPEVMSELIKKQWHRSFIENGMLDVLREWLMPLPDKTLPHLKIRESLLPILNEMSITDDEHREAVKSSGIGRVLMILTKHPDETNANKKIVRRIIDALSRNIFQLSKSYSEHDHAPRILIPLNDYDEEEIMKKSVGENSPLSHARVPHPSTTKYTYRPQSVITPTTASQAEALSNKMQNRRMKERRSQKEKTHAVQISTKIV